MFPIAQLVSKTMNEQREQKVEAPAAGERTHKRKMNVVVGVHK